MESRRVFLVTSGCLGEILWKICDCFCWEYQDKNIQQGVKIHIFHILLTGFRFVLMMKHATMMEE